MVIDAAERLEELEHLLAELVERSTGEPIVVEGPKDREALRALGIRGEIVLLNTGNSVLHTAEGLARRAPSVILLPDWDYRGGQLCRLLRRGIEASGGRFDDHVRMRLVQLTKKEIKDIEGLPGFLRRLRREATKLKS